MMSPLLDRLLLLVFVGSVLLGLYALWIGNEAPDCPTDNPEIGIRLGTASLQVEVAASFTARSCGLAFRDQLAPGHGMLFVFAGSDTRFFWMRDTRIPLALAFIGADRRVNEIVQLSPAQGEQSVGSSQPAQFALETNPHWFRQNGIAVGDRIAFELPSGLAVE